MSWSCPHCEKSFSRKDSMKRHMNSKHSDSSFAPVIPMSQEKCQRFQLVHPFTCMVAGMTGSGKTVWVQSLLQQAQAVIDQPPERIIWCYSQWQNAYTQLLMMIPTIEFVKGIPTALEQDTYLDVNKRNLIVIDDQMIEAGKDNRIVNLFTKGSHHRNLSVIYIVQNLFHQGKGNRSISLNSHYLVLFKNPRDKLQILTLAKQMYPGRTDFFLKQYEEAVRRPYGYLLIDLKTTTQDDCRLRTNVLPGEEGFNQAAMEENIPQELLRYLKQQNLSSDPLLPAMQRLQSGMDGTLSRRDLGEDEKAKQFLQLQNRYLTFKQQLNTPLPARSKPEEMNTTPPVILPASPGDSTTLTAPSTPLNPFNVAPNLNQGAILQGPKAVTPTPLNPVILTPPPTVKSPSPMPSPPKRKRQRIHFVNYLDDDESMQKRRSRRLKSQSHPYKSVKKGEREK